MRSVTRLSMLIIFVCTFTVTQAQTADTDTGFPELELITLENAARLVQLPGELTGVKEGFDVSPDGKQIAVARPDGVYIYGIGSFETPVATIEIQNALEVRDPHFSNQGDKLSITVLMPSPDEEPAYTAHVQLWDIETYSLEQTFESFWLVTGLVFSPDDRFIAGRERAYIPGERISEPSGYLRIWSVDNSRFESPCEFIDECSGRYGITDIEFSPDSQWLFWSIYDFVPGSSYSYNGNFWLIEYVQSTGTFQHYEALWDNSNGPFKLQTSNIDFSSDGTKVASIASASKVWEVETGDILINFPEGVSFWMFMPGDLVIVVDYDEKRLKLFDLASEESVILLNDFDTTQQKVSLSSDGKLLALHDNGTVHFYGIPTESE
jgi:hypothetical protein